MKRQSSATISLPCRHCASSPCTNMKLAMCLVAVVSGSLCCADAAWGQYLSTTAGLQMWAIHYDGPIGTPTWQASKRETYSPLQVQSKMRSLWIAASIYANEHDDQYPDSASTLFAEGYVTDPLLFYNPADANDPPTTIDNDMPDASNSARISFEYFGTGSIPGDPTNPLFIDNSVANNAGLGWNVVFNSGQTLFWDIWPHVFTDIHVPVRPTSPATITSGGAVNPLAFDLPAGAVADVVCAPHSWHLHSEGTLDTSIVDLFNAEGFDDSNSYLYQAGASLVLQDPELVGPAGPAQPVSFYTQFEVSLAKTPTDLTDFVSANIVARWQGTTTYDVSIAQVGLSRYGPVAFSEAVLVEARTLTSTDPGYMPGADSLFVRGYALLTLDIPVASPDGIIFLSGAASANHFVTPDSTPGRFGRATLDAELPTTAAIDQVRIYAPAGYTLEVPYTYGPGDVVLTCLRGDRDLDGDVDAADRVAFETAYTGPLAGVGHTPGDFDDLATFDFDGDADIDCADYPSFIAAWTAAGSPAFYAACESDADADGIFNGDDDCPATPPATLVDDRGCPQGDFNADGTVDIADWPTFVECMAGPMLIPMPSLPATTPQCLNTYDSDGDKDIDLHDAAAFQRLQSAS